jgi:hypothetical protein
VVDPAADVKGGTRSDLLWTCVSHSSLGDLHEHGEDRLLERVAEVGRGRHTCGNELIVFLRRRRRRKSTSGVRRREWGSAKHLFDLGEEAGEADIHSLGGLDTAQRERQRETERGEPERERWARETEIQRDRDTERERERKRKRRR